MCCRSSDQRSMTAGPDSRERSPEGLKSEGVRKCTAEGAPVDAAIKSGESAIGRHFFMVAKHHFPGRVDLCAPNPGSILTSALDFDGNLRSGE